MVQKTQIIKNDKQQNKTKQNNNKKDNTKTTFTSNITKHPSPTQKKKKNKTR